MTDYTQISLRLPTELVDLADKEAERMGKDLTWALVHQSSTRSGVIRLALYWWAKNPPTSPSELFGVEMAGPKEQTNGK
jgi:hypothetical protein